MKKLLSIVLAAAVIISLTACGNEKSINAISENTLPNKYNSSFVQNKTVYLMNETGDGWENITPKSIPENEVIFNVLFIDKNNGWAVGGDTEGSTHITVYRTQNRGKTWEVSTVGEDAAGWANMDFIDKNNGWLLVHQGVAMMHEGVAVLQTKDGGITWETVSRADPQQNEDGTIPFGGDKTGISFKDEKNGWITGYEPVSGFVYLYSTQDGGRTWHEKDIQVPAKYKDVEFTSMPPLFFSDKEGILPLKEGKGMVFYSTADGGDNWSPASEVVLSEENSFLLYSFYNNKHGFVTNGDAMFTTSDQGNTWEETASSLELSNLDIDKMLFTGEKTGWIIGRESNILKTSDGGRTWEKLTASPSTSVELKAVSSPFTQFETLKRGEIGFDSEQVDDILRSYGIYDSILAKVPKEVYNDALCRDVNISGFNIGNKKVAVLLINKGHLYIYVMFSNNSDQWIVDGFAYQNERDKPEYRIERSGDGTRYWLVVKHEANHGTGLYIFDEVWYNPDGSFAAEYPVEGSTWFFPETIEPYVDTYFSTTAYYDGDSKISLSYAISFVYGYKDNSQDSSYYKFRSEYHPVIRDYWEYDLKTQQLGFISSDPALPEGFSAMKHAASSEYGILQGYIDFYKTRLGDKKITTLGEWEKFVGLK